MEGAPVTAQPITTSRLPSLTGLRFIAAALVFAVHGASTGVFKDQAVAADYFTFFGNAGAVGVSFFFLLSGFVLTWSARTGDTTRGFWRRRFFKIVPNHVVTFAAALVLMSLVSAQIAFPQTLANLFLLHAWLPDVSYVETANTVSWSLSVEMLFYLAFPLLIRLVNKVRPNRLWYGAAGAAALVLLLPVIAQHLLPSTPHYSFLPLSWTQIWFVYVFPLSRLLEFLLGMFMARILLTGRWPGLGLLPAGLLAVAAYLLPVFVTFNQLYNYAAVTIVPLALLIPAAAAADVRGRRTWLSTRTFVWLGEISFAFYLVHSLVLTYGHRIFGSQPNIFGQPAGPAWGAPAGLAFLAGCFAVSVLLAWGLYALLERPAMRRWSRPAPAASGARAGVAADT
ncbi:acyltransferase [Streptomyces sp. BHT-5-2]|nr:acyltransferase [Streptomyces sp. BHT-5-2]